MPNPFSEERAVQRPILKYVDEIGWPIIAKDEALSQREGEAGLFFYPILKEQLIKLNQKVITRENVNDVVNRLQNIRNTIEGNKEALEWLRGKKSVYVPAENRERNV
jgi:type I restriction enzyme, R subunit